MLKKSRPKNRRTVLLCWFAGFSLVVYLIACVLYTKFNINLVSNLLPLLSSTTNNRQTFFYGENIDMSQILPTSQHYVVNSRGQDLIDIAADLGINFVRVTNAVRSFGNNANSIYTGEQWNQVLNKMQSKGIKALILIEVASKNKDHYTPDIRPAYLHLVQEYIDSGVFSNPDVYAVDIKNEPVLTDANVYMLQAAHDMIKAKYPDLKQTIGWWATPKAPEDPYKPNNYDWSNYSAGRVLENIVDFYSIHMYGLGVSDDMIGLNSNLRTKLFISRVQDGLQTNKPILIGEFGEANGDAVSDQSTIGNPELQAKVYQGVYQALQEMHSGQIVGAVAFQFYRRTSYPDAWAIVKNNGDYLFPAAYILQEYALGKVNPSPSPQSEIVVSSQCYLVRNADNHRIKNLHISDRIGLKLLLDNNKKYSLSLSAQGLLKPLDVFHYYSGSYYAVYQAIHKGSVQLTILSNATCSIDHICTTQVYRLTINIQ